MRVSLMDLDDRADVAGQPGKTRWTRLGRKVDAARIDKRLHSAAGLRDLEAFAHTRRAQCFAIELKSLSVLRSVSS